MIGLIEKLLALVSVGTALTNLSVLNRFLAGVSTVIALTIISSIMAGLLIVAAFYGLFSLLVHAGIDQDAAVAIVAMIAAAATGFIAWMTLREIRRLQNFAAMHKASQAPSMQRLQSVLQAFISGMTKPHNAPENLMPLRKAR